MSKKWIFYTSFFVVLVVAFYFALTLAIPGFGQKRIPPISHVQSFSFTNQDGKQVTDKDIAGKVYVAEYFFTTCKAICPRMNNNMRTVYDHFKNENDFLILAHTSDPDTDTPDQLKQYADQLHVNTRRWIFLTGRKDSLYNMARASYTIDDPANNVKSIEDDFLHTQFWALVDRNGDVTKVYDGLKSAEVDQLIKDAEKLLQKKK